jgi:Na+/H+ antiporter NhaA
MSDEPSRPGGAVPRRRKLRERVRATVPRLSRFAVEHLLMLPAGVLLALAWVHAEPESYYRFTFAIAFAVNDVAIAFFFALIAKEVVEATAPGGVLHPWGRAMLPVVASIGAAVVPALLFLQLVEVFDDPMLAAGWPATMATDLAVGYFVARLIFRPHPVVPLFLLLGIASDALGFVALTLFNPARDTHLPTGALIVGGAIAIAAALGRLGVRSFWPYLLGAGSVSWLAGKTVGLLAGAGVALTLGYHLPHRVGWRELIVAGFIATMGLSVGLYFSAVLFPPGQLRSELSMAVLLSLAGAPLAVVAATALRVGRFARHPHHVSMNN